MSKELEYFAHIRLARAKPFDQWRQIRWALFGGPCPHWNFWGHPIHFSQRAQRPAHFREQFAPLHLARMDKVSLHERGSQALLTRHD
ncbi:MAG TPA: hypothetical protein VMV87_05265 [Burkholderiales bacterium]|nr:hypothetical protein [Burkholderiales bacterium]